MKWRWLFIPALSLFLGVAAQPAPAADNCYDYCLDQFNCLASVTQEEQNCHNNCEDMCRPGGVEYNRWNSSNPSGSYGAIAYGAGSTASGWAYGKSSADEADKTAMSYCKQNGDDCKLVISFSHACAAIAAGAGNTVTSGKGSTQGEAENAAMSACTARAGKSCAVQAYSCSP